MGLGTRTLADTAGVVVTRPPVELRRPVTAPARPAETGRLLLLPMALFGFAVAARLVGLAERGRPVEAGRLLVAAFEGLPAAAGEAVAADTGRRAAEENPGIESIVIISGGPVSGAGILGLRPAPENPATEFRLTISSVGFGGSTPGGKGEVYT